MAAPSSRRTALACVAALIVGLSGSILVSRSSRSAGEPAGDGTLFISSPAVLKRMSLGYESLLADLYWTRAVQYFGREHHDQTRGYAQLPAILNITTELDPQLNIAYEYGATFLAQKPPDGAGQPLKAAELMRKGIQHNPQAWRLYYTLGFIYSMELKDYRSAAQVFAEGAKVPGAHPWMRAVAASMAEHGRDPVFAHYMWTQMYESATDKTLRANAEKHLIAAETQMDLAQLQQMVDGYRSLTGREPASLTELVQPGWLFRLPRDPSGRAYLLDAGGRVAVQHPEDFPFLEPNTKTDPLLAIQNRH